MLLHILACFLNVLRVHCFVRGSHRFTAIECWLLAKSWEYEYLISFRLSDMFRQIIDGKALADVMETWRMWVTLSLKLVTLKIWKLIAIAGCVVFKKIQHENRKCQKSYVVWFWFFRSNKRDALHTNFFCCCLTTRRAFLEDHCHLVWVDLIQWLPDIWIPTFQLYCKWPTNMELTLKLPCWRMRIVAVRTSREAVFFLWYLSDRSRYPWHDMNLIWWYCVYL